MRILLIMPRKQQNRGIQRWVTPLIMYKPLTLPVLSALVPPELGAHVDCCDEMVDDAARYPGFYDIVGISFVPAESDWAYELARHYRSRGSHVVFGGFHMLYNSEEGLGHADTVVVGPAEENWPRFLRDFAAGRPRRLYKAQTVDPALIPAPHRGALKRWLYVPVPTVIANPGCPNDCAFCVTSKMYHCGPRPLGTVIAELKSIISPVVIFLDPNFFGDRAYAIRLMKALSILGKRWCGAGCIDVAWDDELLYWAKRSGCVGLLVGMESLSGEALRRNRKAFSDPGRYREAVRRFQRYGIHIHGCFILGLDGDTEESLLSLPDQIEYLGLRLARFAILTPCPGSEMYSRMKAEGRILTDQWRDYDQYRVVYRPEGMSPRRLHRIYNRVWEDTYSWKRILGRVTGPGVRSPIQRAVILTSNIGFKYLGKLI